MKDKKYIKGKERREENGPGNQLETQKTNESSGVFSATDWWQPSRYITGYDIQHVSIYISCYSPMDPWRK
jgi:hypothetical protein